MKKIIICFAMFVSLNSIAFAARVSGMDLGDIFGDNQLGLGYNSGQTANSRGQLETALYSDFGTESLRFSINILELGGSLFNNSDRELEKDKFYDSRNIANTDKTFMRGLPRFFVGTGYDFGSVKLAVGYGGKLNRSNDIVDYDYGVPGVGFYYDSGGSIHNTGPNIIKNRYKAKVGNAWYGNDVSLFFESDLDGDNILKIALPIQFGAGMGDDYVEATILSPIYFSDTRNEYDTEELGYRRGTYIFRYDAKDNKSFSLAPQVEWKGALGYFTGMRLTVPFAMHIRKSRTFDREDFKQALMDVNGYNESDFEPGGAFGWQWPETTGYTAESEDLSRTIIGASLEAEFSFISEDELADFGFIPSISFMKAITGNNIDIYSVVGKQNRKNEIDISLDQLINAGYTLKNPWGLKVSLPFKMSIEKFLISITAIPRLDLYVIDSSEITYKKTGSSSVRGRMDPFYGIGYALPVEFSIRPLGNLSFNIGMLAEGRALVDMPSTLEAEIDGSVVWYF